MKCTKLVSQFVLYVVVVINVPVLESLLLAVFHHRSNRNC